MIKKEASIEKYLFIGFLIVLLSVILVDTRYSGYQTMGPMAGPGGYYYGQPPSAQMPDMTPPYSTPMPPEMTYGSPQAPNMQAPTGMPSGPSGNPDMSFYMGPKCNGGEVFTTFPYYPEENSFIYTRPNGEKIKISEFEAYTKCTNMKQKLGPCSLGDEWREGQWGTGCYPIPGVISDHTQPTYEGWESADCCAPIEKVECPSMPDPTNPIGKVQWEACNPGADDYLELECCNTKGGYKCDESKKCVIKPKKCKVGDGPEFLCQRSEGWSSALTRDDPYRAADLTSLHSGTKLVGKVSLEDGSDSYCYCVTDAQKCEVVTPPQMLGEPLSLTHSIGSIRITYSSPLMEPQIFSDGCLNDFSLDLAYLQNKYRCVDGTKGESSWVDCPQGEYCVSSICRRVTCRDDDPGDIAWKLGVAGWSFTDNSGIAQFVELGRDECVTNEQTGLVYLKQAGCINGFVEFTSTKICNYPCINGVCFEPIPTT